MTFDVTGTVPLAIQKTRTYHRFSDAAQDVVDVRIYLGIHFRFADTAARTQGRQVARWVFKHNLRPLHGHHHGHGHHAGHGHDHDHDSDDDDDDGDGDGDDRDDDHRR